MAKKLYKCAQCFNTSFHILEEGELRCTSCGAEHEMSINNYDEFCTDMALSREEYEVKK